MMKREIRSFAVTLILLALPLLMSAQAVIRFQNIEYDFGVIPLNTNPVSHDFRFHNIGDMPLKILTVQAGCKCTAPGWSAGEIAPGDSGYVHVEFDPSGQVGSFRKKITVRTNAVNRSIELHVEGHVEADTDDPSLFRELVLPSATRIPGMIRSDTPRNITLKMSNRGNTTVLIKQVQTDEFSHPLSYPDSLLPGRSRDLIIRVLPPDTPGEFETQIKVLASGSSEHTCTTVITATAVEPARASVDLTVTEAMALIHETQGMKHLVILDIRTPDEFTEGHLENAALINYYDPDFEKSIIRLDRNRAYLVYGRNGVRSAHVVTMMQRLGFNHVYHLKEGYLKWIDQGQPTVQ